MYTVITYSLSPPWWWRGCLLSADLSCTCPLSGGAKEARNQKLETGTLLHNEAWSTAAPSSVLTAREFLLAFGERASGFFKPCA
ncbi:unnamed protein product, partial [Staurois parvus]